MHFTHDVTIQEISRNQYQVIFKGVTYGPTRNLTAIGVLLFGLRPQGVRYDFMAAPNTTMWLIQHAAHILHLHANGDRVTLDGQRRAEKEDLERWIAGAVELAPDEQAAGEVRRLIIENLGPDPFGDGP